jgi:soluble lytic murein transglycosylase
MYVAGKSAERKKDWAGAANFYRQIPLYYPNHSMADDGYALAGIALQETGDLAGARKLWADGLSKTAGGDMSLEIAWRLAWGAYLANDIADAIQWADRAESSLQPDPDITHFLACAYWAGRWRAWPDDSGKISEEKRKEAADRLEAVAKRAPWHYYGILASARLKQLDPGRAAALKRPAMDPHTAPWQVREVFLQSQAVQNALGLIRLGLLADAQAELSSLEESSLTGAEMAIATGVQARAGKFLLAHDRLRSWLKTHPADTLGPNTFKVLRQAYPDAYWVEIKEATRNYSWDPRVFHALVREESNFNPEIKSHAGACGLSQLMPGTASACARKMGVSYSSAKIWDIQTNLNIGAWYLNNLHGLYSGNSAVALSAYNAGEGNADRWLAARPGVPTDSYTESITFRETRFYVKRVLSTYQTYHLIYDGGPVYLDWSKWMDKAVF